MLDYSVVEELRRNLGKLAQELQSVLTASPALLNPKIAESGESELRMKSLSKKELLWLAAISWYIPRKELRAILRFQIDIKLDREKNKIAPHERYFFLPEDVYFSLYLQNSNAYGDPRELFGELLRIFSKDRIQAYKNIFYWTVPTKKAIPHQQRIRGYRDHGSKRPDSAPEPRFRVPGGFKTLNEYLQHIERLTEISNQTDEFLEGWIT